MTTETPSAGARIVVGVDGSEPSKLALGWALSIAATCLLYTSDAADE